MGHMTPKKRAAPETAHVKCAAPDGAAETPQVATQGAPRALEEFAAFFLGQVRAVVESEKRAVNAEAELNALRLAIRHEHDRDSAEASAEATRAADSESRWTRENNAVRREIDRWRSGAITAQEAVEKIAGFLNVQATVPTAASAKQ
jgi:hypothetical protein